MCFQHHTNPLGEMHTCISRCTTGKEYIASIWKQTMHKGITLERVEPRESNLTNHNHCKLTAVATTPRSTFTDCSSFSLAMFSSQKRLMHKSRIILSASLNKARICLLFSKLESCRKKKNCNYLSREVILF